MIRQSTSYLGLLFIAILSFGLFASCDDDDGNGSDFGIDDDGTLFLSSNTGGQIGVVSLDEDPFEIMNFAANGMDADGIYYVEQGSYVYQVDRTNNVLVAYEDVVDDANDDEGVNIVARSTSNFNNGRGLAVSGNSFVVAQDASDANGGVNQFAIYTATEDNISFDRNIQTDINLWGARFMGSNLIAVVDNSDSIAVYNNFLSNTGTATVSPDRFIRIDGLVRTHGLVINTEDNLAIFTDVADANSETDGALFIVENFSTAMNNAVLTASDYRLIAGSNTMLGNPVDVAYDADTDRIYVAERKTGGGKLLVFTTAADGNTAPVADYDYPGLSSLYLHRD